MRNTDKFLYQAAPAMKHTLWFHPGRHRSIVLLHGKYLFATVLMFKNAIHLAVELFFVITLTRLVFLRISHRFFFFFSLSARRKLPLKEENGKESLKPDTIEIKVHSDNSIHTKPDDSKA